MTRAIVMIDGAYLDYILREAFDRVQIDYLRLSEELCRGKERVRTYYYHCMPYQSDPPNDNERRRYSQMSKFIFRLNRFPKFEVRLGKLGKLPDGSFKQKRVDAMLTVDLVSLSCKQQIQHAIIVAGDSDYIPPIQFAKDSGINVELIYHTNSYHRELVDVSDIRTILTQDFIDTVRRG